MSTSFYDPLFGRKCSPSQRIPTFKVKNETALFRAVDIDRLKRPVWSTSTFNVNHCAFLGRLQAALFTHPFYVNFHIPQDFRISLVDQSQINIPIRWSTEARWWMDGWRERHWWWVLFGVKPGLMDCSVAVQKNRVGTWSLLGTPHLKKSVLFNSLIKVVRLSHFISRSK